MNLLNSIEVRIRFSFGAHFHNNIVSYTYNQFLKMVKRLSCISVDCKCMCCENKTSCQYFKITGENFNYYPGIMFKKNGFEKNHFSNNEEFIFLIFGIGNCEKLLSYVNVFFEEYLNNKLAGYYFDIVSIKQNKVYEDYDIKVKSINSVVESCDVSSVYNDMIQYYNDAYGCDYKKVDNMCEAMNIIKVSAEAINLGTKRLVPKGYVYKMKDDFVISNHFELLGIGKYNFLGGGKLEIRNDFRSK